MSGASSYWWHLAHAAGVTGLGLSMLILPGRYRRGQTRRYDRELADRLARGQDRYFEELRAIEAYRKPSPTRTIRIFGGFFIILGGAMLALTLWGKR